MKRRFTLDDDGRMVDRHGYELPMAVFSRSPLLGVVLEVTAEDVALIEGRGGTSKEGGSKALDLETSKTIHPVDPSNGKSIVSEQIRVVWAFYVQTMKPRRTELDPQTAAVIRDALKVANSEECIGAIRGCSKSSHHMGDNDRNKKYNSISHILRGKRGIRTTREQIDLMLTYDDERDSAALPSGVSAEILTAKRTIRQYAPFTANSHAQQLATAAMDKLIRYDITTRVLKAENGTVREIVFSDERQAA